MSFFKRFSDRIEAQNWDHVNFIRNILLLLGIIILFFYIWLLVLYLNGIVTNEIFQESIQALLQGNIIGLISGIILSFCILLPYYLKKEWDLHIVVPAGLFYHVILSISILLFAYFTSYMSDVTETAILTGYLFGGMIPLLAYAGEVKNEHSDELELIPDN